MIILVIGGAGSGKSELAEQICCNINRGKKAYIATMLPIGDESKSKIEKHRINRKEKGFFTIEEYYNLAGINIKGFDTVLIECMSNLLSNIMFMNKLSGTYKEIISGIDNISNMALNTVIVSNNVFCDGIQYDIQTTNYIEQLGNLNQYISDISDIVIEIVCGIPIFIKGQNIYEKIIR